ncbi:cell adhesion molecule Dscam1, partial [Hetaerina americana]|uniref:cell adhesion molecule Dscam1 n=1 Tax=Hetaerina americana TaxID=62018 RepID=UPI003A7F4404
AVASPLLLADVNHGPSFIAEPPHRVEFSNGSGGRVDCWASGRPAPTLEWLLADGTVATPVPRLRIPHPNGSLVFPPFPAERYRHDVHAALYRCRAHSAQGTVLSRDVHVRAVVKQKYEVQVYDEYVISGNTVILRCQVPSYVAEYVMVTSWIQDGTVNIYPNTDTGGKYTVVGNSGDLYVHEAGPSDGYRSYACRTVHRLTGEVHSSIYPGRIIITEPKGSVHPRITVEKHMTRMVKAGDDIILPCVAQGFPVPTYRWYREEREQVWAVGVNGMIGGDKTHGGSGGGFLGGGQVMLVGHGGRGEQRVSIIAGGLLKISKARLEDGGKYICWVNNSAGEETVSVTLTVTAPLSAHIQPQTQMVDVGKEAVFRCSTGGHPISRVHWLKDGQTIGPGSANGRITISPGVHSPPSSMGTSSSEEGARGGGNEDTGGGNTSSGPETLRIRDVDKNDHGMYQCFVSNDWDMAQASSELQLGDARPEIVYYFTEQTLQPGPPVSLKCVANGNPPPQFVWTLDGFPIPENSRFLVGQYVTIHDDVISHVNISSIREEDGGEYSCVARNAVSRVSHSARVNVYGLPFIRPMPRISAISGADLIIKCPVAGYPIESITWERDGAILPINRRQRVYPNGTLVIEQATRQADAGTYTCQAQNRQRHTARRDVEIQVLVPPKILPIQPMTNLLREGMRAAISCQILEGDLPVTFSWERDGHAIPSASPSGSISSISSATTRRLDEYSSSLVIEKLAASHAGNYTCIAQNVAGTESFIVPLTVNVPPRWTVEPADTNVASGQDVILDCQANGYPIPTVNWRKAIGNQPGEYKDFLFEPNVKFYRNGSLEFQHISKDSEGYYLCEAKNGIGTGVSKVIFLKVNAPAYFPQKSKQMQVQKGEQAHLQCTAMGDTPIDITWKIGGQRIAEDMDKRYTIREQVLDDRMVSELGISHTYRHDTGILSCHASNSYGHDQMTIQLIVQEVPETPKNVRVSDQQSRSLQLSWTQPYAGNSPITSYIVQYKLVSDVWVSQPHKVSVGGGQTTAVVGGLSPASSYHFRILAENRLGLSEPSEVIQVTTQEEVPTGAPVGIRVEAKSSTELLVTWEPPPREHWNGDLLGYYVGYRLEPPYSSSASASSSSSSSSVSSTSSHSPSPPVSPYFSSSPPSSLPHADEYIFKTVEASGSSGGGYGGSSSGASSGGIGLGRMALLQGLGKYTTYAVVVQAFNSRGTGPASQPVVARTMEDAPSMPPENVRCVGLTSQSLQVAWDPPPVEGRNGILQGYKVTHRPAEYVFESELDDEDKEMQENEGSIVDSGIETKVTMALRTTLPNLLRYTNYSLSVLAFTASGDGVRSPTLFCRTEEDVPSAPADIKAVISSSSKIMVAWLPPMRPNGILVAYTLYTSVLEEGGSPGNAGKEGGRKRTLGPNVEAYEAARLKESATYQFWVTASTRIGEGESTRVVTVSPSSKVPARIVSFSRSLVTPWKQDLSLPCRRVGVPLPQAVWKLQGKVLEPTSGRKQVTKDGSLLIRDIQHSDGGNYTCSVENINGKDEIAYTVKVKVPPEPPVLSVFASYADSLHLQWSTKNNGGSPILGYVINYKRDYGDWEELQIESSVASHILRGLWCGTHYQLYVTAYNRIGTGLPSDIVSTHTEGTVPTKPPQAQLLTVNATAVTLWLDAWGDGGCPILYYVIEYHEVDRTKGSGSSDGSGSSTSAGGGGAVGIGRKKSGVSINGSGGTNGEWTLISNNVQPTERAFSILDLMPATGYVVRVTAHNNAGSTVAVYNFTTLTPEGVTVSPDIVAPTTTVAPVTLYANLKIIIPIAVALCFVIGLIAVAIFIQRKKMSQAQEEPQENRGAMGESPSVAQMQNQQNRDQQYLAVARGSHRAQSVDATSFKAESSADYIEDICPYATFQLSKAPYSESTYSGNVYSGPYHSVQGSSFVYHDVKPTPMDTYKLRHSQHDVISKSLAFRTAVILPKQKEPEYTKVRRKGARLRDPHSESQESDNLGSTDSEVKKILTLHLPISEYDTLGSDSEAEALPPPGAVGGPGVGMGVGGGKPPIQGHELVSFRHRMAREAAAVVSAAKKGKSIGSGSKTPSRPAPSSTSSSSSSASSSSSEEACTSHGGGGMSSGSGQTGGVGGGGGGGSRKGYGPRKGKAKGQVSGKRQVRSSSGYSSHTEETTFSFGERIHPPSRFSDSHELSEAECDREKGKSSGSLGSIGLSGSGLVGGGRKPLRVARTRDTSFQINV